VVKAERLVLRVLCTGTPQGPVRESARQFLRDYSWREPAHQVIFDALESIPSDLPEVIYSQLPARLTLRGFPDIDCEDFFQPHSLPREEAVRLMEELCSS
jgi:hypothetical protein